MQSRFCHGYALYTETNLKKKREGTQYANNLLFDHKTNMFKHQSNIPDPSYSSVLGRVGIAGLQSGAITF